MAKRQKRKRSVFLPLLAVLLVLALAGTVLFSAFREKIDRWEYPQRYEEYVEYYAGKYGIDPMILYAFIRTESNFDPNVDSDAGARGLMQITEVTFDWIKTKIAPTEDLTFDDLYDPETNIRFGSYFVSYRRGGLPQRGRGRGRAAERSAVLVGRHHAGSLPLPADAAVCKENHRELSTLLRDI